MKGRKTDLAEEKCGIARALSIIGDWWSLMIVREAIRGRQRFGEFQTSLGLARNILSARLKKLVENGIFEMVPESEGSAYHAYVLTEKGEQLGVVLIALWQWGREHCFEPGEFSKTMVDRKSGEPLARLELQTTSGKRVRSRDYQLAPIVQRPR
jgi:DNA-binding HxlR family transcriptional regulator